MYCRSQQQELLGLGLLGDIESRRDRGRIFFAVAVAVMASVACLVFHRGAGGSVRLRIAFVGFYPMVDAPAIGGVEIAAKI